MSQARKQKKSAGAKDTLSRPVAGHTRDGHAPPLYDPAEGKAALAQLGPALDAVGESELAVSRVDVEIATFAALGVTGFVSSPVVRARFARLPVEEIDQTSIDGLAAVCFAMLYALAEARAAGALETDARIPASIVTEASELEQRMQRLCEYHFMDDPVIGPELLRLRPGVGHRDLANDLLGYARIYAHEADVVEHDAKNYRADDVARARALAGVIIQALAAAMTPRARTAYDRYLRVWSILERRYDEVRTAGLWLFRNDLRKEELFPSLFTAGRPNVGRRRKGDPEATNGKPGSAEPAVNGAAPNGPIV